MSIVRDILDARCEILKAGKTPEVLKISRAKYDMLEAAVKLLAANPFKPENPHDISPTYLFGMRIEIEEPA